MTEHPLAKTLSAIASHLERIAPRKPSNPALTDTNAYVWQPDDTELFPIKNVNCLPLSLLKGIDRQAKALLENTRQHAKGYLANNVLLWGARGTGKSSLIKSVHAAVNEEQLSSENLVLVEIHREDIPTLPKLLNIMRVTKRQCLLFCDDLSFEGVDDSYKALKAVLEGGLEGRPQNVLFYATSNRRHLMARNMIENERETNIHRGEATEEKVSLSDRFGLWLGFHHIDQDTFLEIVEAYAEHLNIDIPVTELRAQATEWAVTRGARSGRVAWQFIQNHAGRLGKTSNSWT